MVVALAPTVTDGVDEGVTIVLIALEVALTGEAQLAFEVITTVTTSPLAKVVDVNVGELVPALAPFTFHW